MHGVRAAYGAVQNRFDAQVDALAQACRGRVASFSLHGKDVVNGGDENVTNRCFRREAVIGPSRRRRFVVCRCGQDICSHLHAARAPLSHVRSASATYSTRTRSAWVMYQRAQLRTVLEGLVEACLVSEVTTLGHRDARQHAAPSRWRTGAACTCRVAVHRAPLHARANRLQHSHLRRGRVRRP